LDKNVIEQSKNSSFEIKCRIARIEIGYSSRNLSLVQDVKKSSLPFL